MELKKTRLAGREFWYRGDDRYIGQRIAAGKYEPYLTKKILRLASLSQDDMVVADVGANIGYYTVLLAKKARKIYAIEPEEKTFEILKKNCEGLGNITTLNMAAGDRNGEVELKVSKENYGDHKINNQFSKSNFQLKKVKIRKLDSLIKGQVDLMKIDVQGFENEVIEGAKKIIGKYRPTIFFEVSKKKSYEKDKKIFKFLKSFYKDIYFIDEYIQIYYPVSFEWIKNYLKKKEQGNFVVFRDNNWMTKVRGLKDFWMKKWVKRRLGRVET